MWYLLCLILAVLLGIWLERTDTKAGSPWGKMLCAIVLAIVITFVIWLVVELVAALFWPLAILAVIIALILALKKKRPAK